MGLDKQIKCHVMVWQRHCHPFLLNKIVVLYRMYAHFSKQQTMLIFTISGQSEVKQTVAVASQPASQLFIHPKQWQPVKLKVQHLGLWGVQNKTKALKE